MFDVGSCEWFDGSMEFFFPSSPFHFFLALVSNFLEMMTMMMGFCSFYLFHRMMHLCVGALVVGREVGGNMVVVVGILPFSLFFY